MFSALSLAITITPWTVPEWLAYVTLGIGTVFVLLIVLNKVPLVYNVLNMVVRWRNTLMTAMAFAMVIGLLTVMQAFINGMYDITEGSGKPGNVMILAEGATDEVFSSLALSDASDIETLEPILKAEDGRPLVTRETFLVANQPVRDPRPGRPKQRIMQIRGLVDGSIGGMVHGLELFPGDAWFSEAGVRADELDPKAAPLIEVVLGEGLAGELVGERIPLDTQISPNPKRLERGDRFELNRRVWVVTGVMQRNGSSFDSEAWAKQSIVGPLFGKNNYTTMVARTTDANAAGKFCKFLIDDYGKAELNAIPEMKYYQDRSSTNLQFLGAIVIVSVIMAAGGGFGVANTMYAAIAQRKKDIGVLRLMGFSRLQIMISFLLESMLLGLVGAAAGCLVGMFCDGITANSVVAGAQGGGGRSVVLELSVTGTTLLVGLLLGLSMGFFGGLLPSLAAVRGRTLKAFR